MVSATPATPVLGGSTESIESRRVGGCANYSEWPKVADAVIDAQAPIDEASYLKNQRPVEQNIQQNFGHNFVNGIVTNVSVLNGLSSISNGSVLLSNPRPNPYEALSCQETDDP
jgi:hypothetical protein